MEYIDIKNGYTNLELEKVKQILENGGVCILPTDTVYGIVCDSQNEESVKKIYNLKRREISNPMSIVASNINMIKDVSKKISKVEQKIIKKFLPGALTIILKKNERIPKIVTSGLDTMGIRIPDNKFLLDLIEKMR